MPCSITNTSIVCLTNVCHDLIRSQAPHKKAVMGTVNQIINVCAGTPATANAWTG